MKKNLRYGLIAVLILALLVVTGLVASAAGEVKLLDSTEAEKGAYDTLAAAAAATADGDIINITADLADQAAVAIAGDEGAIITLRGNGHTVAFANGAGITVAAGTTFEVENVTLTSADGTAVALTMDADSWDLNMTDVTISGFGTGVTVDTPALMDFTNVEIEVERVGINLLATSTYGELTLTDCAIRLTSESPVLDDACIRCNGADVIIESGTYRSPKNNSAGQQAMFLWTDGGAGSHLTINDGTFSRWTNACVLFMLRGDGANLPNFGGDACITINGGEFTAYGNNAFFRDVALPIKDDANAENYCEIVINGGTFLLACTNSSGTEPFFHFNGPTCATITDGNFTIRGGGVFMRAFNTRSEAGHAGEPVVSNILGGTFTTNALVMFQSSAANCTVLNFGAPGEAGPHFTIRKGRIDGGTGRGAFYASNGSAAHCKVNFYSGTYDILNEYGLNQNGDGNDASNLKMANFIHAAGAGFFFYGGTFNYDMDGYFVRLGDSDQYSVVSFLKNDGENGITLNMGPKAQRFLRLDSANHDSNMYGLTEGHMVGGDPAEYAAKGDKVILTIAYGTFRNGHGWIDVTGSGFELNIGTDGEDEGPTFILDADNDYGVGFIHFSNACSTLYSKNVKVNGVDTLRETKTVGTVNIYGGTFDIQADVEALFNCHGGKLHIEGGEFTTNSAGIFQWRDQDKIGELEVEGGTFTLTGSGKIINYAVNWCVGNAYKGAITLTGGTFAATGDATGTIFSLTSPNHIDDAEKNKGTAIFTLGSGVTLNKVATARYFNIGAKMHTDLIVIQGERVFAQDPTAGLGGYKPVAVAGGYKVQLTAANKVFYGATMSLTNEYQLHTFWKLTEAEAAAFTKLAMTGIKGCGSQDTIEITEHTVRDTYPDSSAVEAGYKLVEVVLPKMPIAAVTSYFNLALYVNGNLTASIDYSAHEYLQILSYNLEDEKAVIQADLLAINAEATAQELAAAVAEQVKVQKLAATLVKFSVVANAYTVRYVETEFQRLVDSYSPYYVKIDNDKGFMSPYLVGYEALDVAKAAAWTYTANTNANLTGVGARFDATMQLYVKFTAADLTGIEVTYKIGEGAPQACRIENVGGDNYVAYTQFTNLDNLTADVTFTLSGDTNTQTCTYSFGAFVYSYQNGSEKVNDLAKTLKQFMDAVAQYVA